MKERIERRQDAANLVWIDLEMTGLDPRDNVILQAALIVTDRELTPLEEYVVDIWQPLGALTNMVPFVREMHQKTGLLERVASSKVHVTDAEKALLERVAGWCPYRPVLCGNSIASDRKFIDAYMPALAGYLHYRMVDVSTHTILASQWYGGTAVYPKPTSGEHDALFDIRESIAELKHYRTTLFKSA